MKKQNDIDVKVKKFKEDDITENNMSSNNLIAMAEKQ